MNGSTLDDGNRRFMRVIISGAPTHSGSAIVELSDHPFVRCATGFEKIMKIVVSTDACSYPSFSHAGLTKGETDHRTIARATTLNKPSTNGP